MTPSAASTLAEHGISDTGTLHFNLSAPRLVEEALKRGEGLLTERGALVAYTGKHTGRSPKDRYLVVAESQEDKIAWGAVNRALDAASFERLHEKVRAYYRGRELFVCDAVACAEPGHHLPVRVIADKAWHALFSQCLLRAPDAARRAEDGLTILVAADLQADPAVDGTRSETFIILNLAKKLVLIGGTHYAGEIKKAVFSFLNYLLPQQGVFPMHCSANTGANGDTALFFGLSGTGKTTLSADPERQLIGDDEHGWSEEGVFNIEGGCYAKCVRLSEAGEPQIWNAIRFGSVLENVVVDPLTRRPDFDSEAFTENTRAAYPVRFIDRAEPTSRGAHPQALLFLTCDAFGVLPPLSRLTPEQALYHFLSGYTAKVAGTEAGVTEPEATFSTCFAAPFLPLYPARYAEMLHQKLQRYGSQVWLVNTGWSGGPYGRGKRIPLAYTRAMVRAVLNGSLKEMSFTPDPIFGVQVPQACPGVPAALLRPRTTWPNPADYDVAAQELAKRFHNNFVLYAATVTEAVRQAGPR